MRKDAAVGVDGITKEQYGQALEANLQDLHARLVAKRYRHQPIRRVHISKGQGKMRRLGSPSGPRRCREPGISKLLEPDFFHFAPTTESR